MFAQYWIIIYHNELHYNENKLAHINMDMFYLSENHLFSKTLILFLHFYLQALCFHLSEKGSNFIGRAMVCICRQYLLVYRAHLFMYLFICLFVCLSFCLFFFFQNFISNIKLIIIFTLQKYQNDPSVANTFIYSTLWYKGKYIIIVKKAPMQ